MSEEQQDPPWHARERELRFAESSIQVVTAMNRLCGTMDSLRCDLAATPVERFTRSYPRQAVGLFVVLVALSSLIGACVGLAFGGAS